MTRVHGSLAVAVTVGLVAGCGDPTGDDGPTLADLAGTWNASQMLWTEKVIGKRRSFNFIESGGAIALSIDSDGSVSGLGTSIRTGSFTLTGRISVRRRGTLAADLHARNGTSGAPALLLPREFAFTLFGGTLTLSNLATAFDFALDGSPEDATLVIVLRRS